MALLVVTAAAPNVVMDTEKVMSYLPHRYPFMMVDKIVEGRMNKFYEEFCLYEQPFIKDGTVTIGQLIALKVAKTGENIAVARFARFKLGEAGE